MAYQRRDHYYRKAKEEGFAARSAYKLEEIDRRFRLLAKGARVLDLGAAPGSWSQYASRAIGPEGRILGIDLSPISLSLANARFVVADLREADLGALAGDLAPFDIVLSDMAPKTTGIRVTDQARSLELCELAFGVAERVLSPGGAFVCKLFHGGDFEGFRAQLRARFERVECLRPDSTRKESKEIFLLGLAKRRAPS